MLQNGVWMNVTNPCNRIGRYGDQCGEGEIWMLGTHLLGLDLLVGGKESVGDGALQLTHLLGSAPVGYKGRGSVEPGKHGEYGRHGRRPPWREDA